MYERELIVLPRYRIARVGKSSFIIKLSECENPPQAITVTEILVTQRLRPENDRSLTNLHLRTSAYGADSLTEVAAHLASYPLSPPLLKDFGSLPTRKRKQTQMDNQKLTAAKKTEDAKAKTRQRRAHTRSRAGCSECRSRRIRCGEQRPKW